MRAASGRLLVEPRELAAEMLLMLPLEADMDWLRAELGLVTSKHLRVINAVGFESFMNEKLYSTYSETI